jgi:uncharacterized membrane protein
MNATTLWGFVLSALWLGSACGHAHDHAAAATQAACPPARTTTYESFGRAFFAKYCVSCHAKTVPASQRSGAPSDHNFDALEEIRKWALHIDTVAGAGPAVVNTMMPPQDPVPTIEERRALAEWLACGAP